MYGLHILQIKELTRMVPYTIVNDKKKTERCRDYVPGADKRYGMNGLNRLSARPNKIRLICVNP